MIVGAVFLAVLVFGVFGAVDAAVRPFAHWEQVGRNKAAWIVGQGLVVIPILNILGLVAAIAYFAAVRPRLQVAARESPHL